MCQDLYSTEHGPPSVDVENSYTTDSIMTNGSFIDFVTYRDLTPSNVTAYVIPLDQE